jgi:hypothetical protein
MISLIKSGRRATPNGRSILNAAASALRPKCPDPEAARGILTHISELEDRSPQVHETLNVLRETLSTVIDTRR